MIDGPSKIKQNLGAHIKEARERRSLTQEELSEITDMSPKHLSNIEVGRKFISSDFLSRISLALEVSPGMLFDGTNIKPPKHKTRVIGFIVTGDEHSDIDAFIDSIQKLADKTTTR